MLRAAGGAQPPPYRQCRECDFWVTAADAVCANCGILAPYRPRRARLRPSPAVVAPALGGNPRAGALLRGSIAGGLIAWFGTAVLANQYGWEVAGGAIPVELLPAVLGVPVGAVASWRVQHAIDFPRSARVPRAREYLCLFERTVKERLAALAARDQTVCRSLARVRDEPDAEPWKTLRAALGSAAGSLNQQRSEYQAELWKITALRLENALEASTAGPEDLSGEDCGRRLESLRAARSAAEGVLARWGGEESGAGRDCLARLRALLPLCEQARQTLVAQEAVEALRAASPGAHSPPAGLPPLPDRSSHLAARSEVHQMAHSLAALESEFARLAAEEELLGTPSRGARPGREPSPDG